MMKFKKKRIGIRSKIWLAIMAVLVAVIAAVWFLQVVFLENYYVTIKKGEFSDLLFDIVTVIDKKGFEGSQDVIYDIAAQNVLCIGITDQYGQKIVTYEGLNYNCYIHGDEQNRFKFINYANEGRGNPVIVTIAGTDEKPEYFVGACKSVVSSSNISYIVTVSMSLAPVTEVAGVIRSQLLIIIILIAIIATAAAFFISHGLTKNIIKISNAAKRVAAGDLNVNVQVSSNDELRDLSENFNEMTKEISKVSVLQKELIANISHDIRTPLTMIKGYAEAIKDITGDDKKVREEQLDIIIDESNRLNNLINNVLDLSLMQAGQAELKLENIDIALKLADIMSRYKLLEETSGFEFSLQTQENAMIAIADETRIEQVIYNLLSNAINHSKERKFITLKASYIEDNSIRIEVIDLGEGIAKEDLPLIWDRYYKSYNKKAKGTGLGLSIVKAILLKHGSRFGVMSKINEGSNFWFTLKRPTNRSDLT